MRRVFWLLLLAATCGCTAFSAPASHAKRRPPSPTAMIDFDGPAVASDYGNKLTL